MYISNGVRIVKGSINQVVPPKEDDKQQQAEETPEPISADSPSDSTDTESDDSTKSKRWWYFTAHVGIDQANGGFEPNPDGSRFKTNPGSLAITEKGPIDYRFGGLFEIRLTDLLRLDVGAIYSKHQQWQVQTFQDEFTDVIDGTHFIVRNVVTSPEYHSLEVGGFGLRVGQVKLFAHADVAWRDKNIFPTSVQSVFVIERNKNGTDIETLQSSRVLDDGDNIPHRSFQALIGFSIRGVPVGDWWIGGSVAYSLFGPYRNRLTGDLVFTWGRK